MDISLKISKNTKNPNNNSGDPARFANINFYASQGPLPSTCTHHLQMIFENNIDFVIMLTKLTEDENKGRLTIIVQKHFQFSIFTIKIVN